MNWYYAEKGKQSGPVTEAQLGALLRKGTITVETLIWRDGLPGWAPYRQVFGGAPPPDPSGPIEPPTGPEAVCTKCGKMFPLQQTIRHGEGRICNTCRPIVLQKSQQNANPGGLSYAPILTRFAAVFLDGLILGAINMTLAYLMGGLDITQTDPRKILATQGLLLAITAAIAMTYEGVMVGTYGATLGKMACRIKVVRADGGDVSYLRAFARFFGRFLSGFTCLLGYIIALFDSPQNRALHDYLCHTRVILR